MIKLRHGHAPSHARNMFLDAIDAFVDWPDDQPELTVELEVNYEPRPITLSQACGLMWNCTDIVPGMHFRHLTESTDLAVGRPKYAACARAMLPAIREAAASSREESVLGLTKTP